MSTLILLSCQHLHPLPTLCPSMDATTDHTGLGDYQFRDPLLSGHVLHWPANSCHSWPQLVRQRSRVDGAHCRRCVSNTNCHCLPSVSREQGAGPWLVRGCLGDCQISSHWEEGVIGNELFPVVGRVEIFLQWCFLHGLCLRTRCCWKAAVPDSHCKCAWLVLCSLAVQGIDGNIVVYFMHCSHFIW